jgi:hypothetical protein
MVGAALATCPPGEWISVDTLFAAMRRGNMSPSIARNDMALWKLYLVDAQYGSLGYAGFGDWAILEGRYTLAVLFEYAATLGLIDVDYVHPAGARDDFRRNWGAEEMDALSRYDGLLAIRLTALGAYVVGLENAYRPATVPEGSDRPLAVLPGLEVVATTEIPTAERLILAAYTRQTGDHLWTVSASSLLSAIDIGRDLREFTSFLAERTQNELPAELTALIADVQQRAGQLIDLGHARVIECADPTTAKRIAHDRTLRALCRLIGTRHLLVPSHHEAKFRKALIELGYATAGRSVS